VSRRRILRVTLNQMNNRVGSWGRSLVNERDAVFQDAGFAIRSGIDNIFITSCVAHDSPIGCA
jgi:hypothetical protein